MEIRAWNVDDGCKWLFMKEISISEFRTHCSRLIWEVSKTKQPIRIMRRGKAVAEVHPPSPKAGDWIGSMKGSMKIVGDIVSPASEESDWEVLRDEIRQGAEQADRGQFVDGAEVFAKIRKKSARRRPGNR
jgi:antitoxin (DNA-binding transcriptional repressor) of toxin-antitoxin stability system